MSMKLRITDVKKVIGELIAETWTAHSYERKFKVPNAEEQERIQREFGIKIDFSNCIHNAEYLDARWNVPTERGNSLFYFLIGLTIKEVHSTLDENYALALASINYSDPFGPAQEYMAMAYGPLELMKQLELSVRASVYGVYPNDQGEGTDMARKALGESNIYNTIINIIYSNVYETSRKRGLKVETRFKGKERTMFFGLPDDVKNVTQEAMKAILERTKYHLQTAVMKPGVRIDVRGDEYLYYHMELYNRYTGMWMARLNFFDVTFQWADLHRPPN